ncbi:MAG: hypothetical protein LBQ18_03520 [Campylobacteraceae bacterium]|jgi:hypothetical protein|nr:hypothetical protein [Campylobacteraceae bacterium]
MKKAVYAISIVLILVFFIGCGGVGDEDEQGGLVSDCSGASFCSGYENRYTGGGIGVWSYKNNGASSIDLNISLSNTTNRNITAVFTNEGYSNIALPRISVDISLKKEIYGEGEEQSDTIKYTPLTIREVDLKKYIRQDDQNQALQLQAPLYKTWSNSNQLWYVQPANMVENRYASLRGQTTVSGRTINIWVEDSEYNSTKISAARVSTITSGVSTIYTHVTSIAGEPWGAYSSRYALISQNQPLHIVLVNFDKNGRGGGTVGYFYGLNNVVGESGSNEALAIFVDTETLYLGGENGTVQTLSTIAHELTHAINFYQRRILMNDSFDTFLDELSAVMMEDVIAKKISPTFNDVRMRYKEWLEKSLYDCDFTSWKKENEGEDCKGNSINNYSVAGSLGAFLLRQYGISFYKKLFETRSDSSVSGDIAKSLNILDKAIKSYDSGGLSHALRNWGAGIAMIPTSDAPQGFGYPYRNDSGFELEAFDGNDYKSSRSLPTSPPSILAARAHFPFLRKPSSYTYAETFTIPRGVSVSVIVK